MKVYKVKTGFNFDGMRFKKDETVIMSNDEIIIINNGVGQMADKLPNKSELRELIISNSDEYIIDDLS